MRGLVAFLFMTGIVAAGDFWAGRCIGVVDAETIRVQGGKGVYDVRIYGVACPKYGEEFHLDAVRFTHSLTNGKTVTIETVSSDPQGRIVGLVTVDGLSLTDQLISAGLGAVSNEDCSGTRLCLEWRQAQSFAMRDKRGIWSRTLSSQLGDQGKLAHTEAQAEKYLQKAQKIQNELAGRHDDSPPPPPPPTPRFYGTTQSKRYHRVTCRHTRTPYKIPFSTPQEAAAAGFTPCTLCKP